MDVELLVVPGCPHQPGRSGIAANCAGDIGLPADFQVVATMLTSGDFPAS